jgi:hypothetical protein
MNDRPRWHDADAALRGLTSADQRTLLLLARLPLLWASVLEALSELQGRATVYRSLNRLETAGLVNTARIPFRAGASPRFLYLTDLGLATVALHQGVEPASLARRNRLRAADLLGALPALPQLVACYELLAVLAASRPGPPNLLAWERPWRRRYRRVSGRGWVTVELPAYAAFAWGDDRAAFILLPDCSTAPLSQWRCMLGRLLILRRLIGGTMPRLLVATTDDGRAAAWDWLLAAVSRAHHDASFAAHIATWSDLRAGLAPLAPPAPHVSAAASGLSQRIRLQRLRARQSRCPIPRLAGDAFAPPAKGPPSIDCLGRVALCLAPSDRALLDLVGQHPLLSPADLAAALNWTPEWARARRNRLIAVRLIRLVGSDEIGERAGLGLAELTVEGLQVVAAQQGLTLAAAVRHLGLVGGGPEPPIGARRQVLKNLEHTLGVNATFIGLYRVARKLAERGYDDAVVEWRGAAACSHHRIRPDGYGIYRHRGQLCGFFLEYDRGTMSGRDYREKFAAYYDYRAAGHFEQEYEGFPTILVVTSDPGPEERIAKAVRAVAVGRGHRLPVLLTTLGRIATDEHGPLGPVWREPWTTVRRGWLVQVWQTAVAWRAR